MPSHAVTARHPLRDEVEQVRHHVDGVRVADLFDRAGVKPSGTHLMAYSEFGYTTNVPLDGIRTMTLHRRARPRPADRGRTRRAGALWCPSGTSGSRQNRCASTLSGPRRASGSATATTTTATRSASRKALVLIPNSPARPAPSGRGLPPPAGWSQCDPGPGNRDPAPAGAERVRTCRSRSATSATQPGSERDARSGHGWSTWHSHDAQPAPSRMQLEIRHRGGALRSGEAPRSKERG